MPNDLRPLADRVKQVWRSIDLPEYNAMHDWSERDLLRVGRDAPASATWSTTHASR